MFDEYIENTAQSIFELFEKSDSGNYNFRSIIDNPNLDAGYKNFFEAELNWWIFAEVSDLVNSEHFDYTTTTFFSANLDDELRAASFITEFKLKELIEFAVTTRMNFLCRPQFTLDQFIYNGKESVSCDEALMRLNYFTDYSYIKNGLKVWLNQQQENEIDFVSKEEFIEKLSEVEYEYVLNLSSEEFVNLLDPMFVFFNSTLEGSEELLIPTEALMIFFDDKNIKPLVRILERNYTQENLKLISKESLYNFINEMIEASENDEIEDRFIIENVDNFKEEQKEDFDSIDLEEKIAEEEIFLDSNDEFNSEDVDESETLEYSEELMDEVDNVDSIEELSAEDSNSDEISDLNNNSGFELDSTLADIENLIQDSQDIVQNQFSEDEDLLSEINALNLNTNTISENKSIANLNTIQSINSELESFAGIDEDNENEIETASEYRNLQDFLNSNPNSSDKEDLDELISEMQQIGNIDDSELNIPATDTTMNSDNLDEFAKDIENLLN